MTDPNNQRTTVGLGASGLPYVEREGERVELLSKAESYRIRVLSEGKRRQEAKLDRFGRIVSLSLNGGSSVEFNYDEQGHMKMVRDSHGDACQYDYAEGGISLKATLFV